MVAAASDRIPRVPPYSGAAPAADYLPVRGSHPLRLGFPADSGSLSVILRAVLQPRTRLDGVRFGLFPFRSPLLGESMFLSLPAGTEMFQFPAFAPGLRLVTGLRPAGLPHSDMRGSIPACGSPRLFAACHVLPRLLKPRHPPSALVTFSSECFTSLSRSRLEIASRYFHS